MNRRALFRCLAAILLLPVLWRRSATSTQAAVRLANSSARRVRPSDPSWPTAEIWEKLKQQVGGHLIQVQSPLGSERKLQDELWQLVLGSLGSLQIGPVCALSLRAWIAIAVARMRLENRLSPQDLAIAHANLRRLIDIMKTESFIQGHVDRLDNDFFLAAHRNIERHAMLPPSPSGLSGRRNLSRLTEA